VVNLSESKPETWRAPSWSWTSTNTKIAYESLKSKGPRVPTSTTVLDVSCTPMVKGPMGELESGYIILCGVEEKVVTIIQKRNSETIFSAIKRFSKE